MKSFTTAAVAALCLLACLAPLQAQNPNTKSLLGELRFLEGAQTIDQANAVLALDTEFRYLAASDARRVLEEFWGNPPDDTVLGMVVPAQGALDDPESWAVVVTYSDDGYVSDEEAAAIDYDALLQELKEGTSQENEMRRQAGYPTVELVGWATAPRYDATAKKLHWAKELAFEGSEDHTVNYDVRVLGRRGYLSLNAVSNKAQLAAVEAGMRRLIPQASFVTGERYADFDESSDKVAAYGIAALVGGTLAAKTGLFAKLFALLLAAKKIVIPLAIGAVVLVARLFKRKSDAKSM
jgi:uncharacterized membrane-anchored protein